APGSVALFMSDGIVEAQNTAGELYGFERAEALLNALPSDISAQGVVDRVLAAVREHLGTEEAQDDLTILVIRSLVTTPATTKSEAAAKTDNTEGEWVDAVDAETTSKINGENK
ncbi:MAG: SpoIIE family protein phosphatase, partial [Anaerolineae bacterium]|nr:SpoIIE family protein phosphatase [Anaerolineae bacterium]